MTTRAPSSPAKPSSTERRPLPIAPPCSRASSEAVDVPATASTRPSARAHPPRRNGRRRCGSPRSSRPTPAKTSTTGIRPAAEPTAASSTSRSFAPSTRAVEAGPEHERREGAHRAERQAEQLAALAPRPAAACAAASAACAAGRPAARRVRCACGRSRAQAQPCPCGQDGTGCARLPCRGIRRCVHRLLPGYIQARARHPAHGRRRARRAARRVQRRARRRSRAASTSTPRRRRSSCACASTTCPTTRRRAAASRSASPRASAATAG